MGTKNGYRKLERTCQTTTELLSNSAMHWYVHHTKPTSSQQACSNVAHLLFHNSPQPTPIQTYVPGTVQQRRNRLLCSIRLHWPVESTRLGNESKYKWFPQRTKLKSYAMYSNPRHQHKNTPPHDRKATQRVPFPTCPYQHLKADLDNYVTSRQSFFNSNAVLHGWLRDIDKTLSHGVHTATCLIRLA